MSYFSEVFKNAGLKELTLSHGYNVINYNGETLYIEGVLRLVSVDADVIKIELKGANVSICGEDLTIYELSDSIIIKGKIRSTEFLRINNYKKGK